jgi:hypothetical protein
MAVLDYDLIFSDAQAQTSVASHNSTNTIDFQTANTNIGAGTPLYFVFRVNTTFTSSSSATFSLSLQHSSDGTTWNALASTATTLGYALFTAGKVWSFSLPTVHERYLKVVYAIGTAVLSAGKWDSYIALSQPRVPVSSSWD